MKLVLRVGVVSALLLVISVYFTTGTVRSIQAKNIGDGKPTVFEKVFSPGNFGVVGSTIFDNGGLATGTMTNSGLEAPSGTEWSELQNETGNTLESNTLSGISCSVTATVFRCADDFVIPTGQTWTVQAVETFAYQTGFAGTTSPIVAGTLQIWDGVPGDPGSSIIFGDETTDRLTSSEDAFLYRLFNSAVPAPGSTPGTSRKVWKNSLAVSPGLVLTEGTYWVDWNTQIGVTTGHFAPTVTIPGVRGEPGWNGRQRIAGDVWQDVIDGGNPDAAPDFPLDFPFKIVGSNGIAVTQPASADFDGDGKTDYSVVRDVTPGLVGSVPRGYSIAEHDDHIKGLASGNIFEEWKSGNESRDLGAPAPNNTLQWWAFNSGDSSFSTAEFGSSATDFWVPADFDGDGKSDIAVWRGLSNNQPTGNGVFFVMNSSDNTVDTIDFGILGDNPTIAGDYDGDGKADPAVFRCANGGGQCTFFYQGSAGSGVTFVPFGNSSSGVVRPYPGDFDGDGSYDFAVFRADPVSGQGQYVVLRSSDGQVQFINWGQPLDPVIAPGDYDGDGRTDFMNVRVESGAVNWYLLESDGGGGGASPVTFGTTTIAGSSEFHSQGDFDGDGSTDIGIWRRNNTSGLDSVFYVLRSSDGALQTFEWGDAGDLPVVGWNGN